MNARDFGQLKMESRFVMYGKMGPKDFHLIFAKVVDGRPLKVSHATQRRAFQATLKFCLIWEHPKRYQTMHFTLRNVLHTKQV